MAFTVSKGFSGWGAGSGWWRDEEALALMGSGTNLTVDGLKWRVSQPLPRVSLCSAPGTVDQESADCTVGGGFIRLGYSSDAE